MSPLRNESWRIFLVAARVAASNPSRSSFSPRTISFLRCYSSAPPEAPTQPSPKMAHPDSLKGQSGRIYTIEKVLQEKEFPASCVYLATYEL